MRSAVCSTSCSLTLQPKEFQSFHPIGGVRARPLFSATAGVAVANATTGTAAETSNSAVRILVALLIGHLFDANRERRKTSLSAVLLRTTKDHRWAAVNIELCRSRRALPHRAALLDPSATEEADHASNRTAARGRPRRGGGARGRRFDAAGDRVRGVQRRRTGDAP